MICRWATALLVPCLLLGCDQFSRPPPPAPAHYTLGSPYQLGGTWYYPKDQAEYDVTGLAGVSPNRTGLTADGERFDQADLAASHTTLQLPAIARVTNLENGRSVLVRLNDRGPNNPARLIGLTRHAASLLGATDGTQIRLQLDPGMTRTLTEQVGGGPKLDVAAAPRAAIVAEQLAPPGTPQVRSGGGAHAIATGAAAGPAAAPIPDRLPDQVTQGPASPGRIVLRASEFGRADYANREAAQLGGLNASVERLQDGRSVRYRVRAGPFPTVAAADAALEQAKRAGVVDSRLLVE